MRRRICVVGNAPLTEDFSHIVDSSNTVIRVNDCKNYNGLSGQRTDIVLVNNLGESASRYIVDKPFLNKEICAKSKKFIIVRDFDIHEKFLISTNQQRSLRLIEDHTDGLIHHNKINPGGVKVYSKKFNAKVFDTLLKFRTREPVLNEPFLMPSTGVFAVIHALELGRANNCDVSLIGFEFNGWRGHPWQSERRLCSKLHEENLLFWHRSQAKA